MLKRSCIKSLSSKFPKFWFCGVFSPSLDMNLSRDFSILSKYHLREEISSPFPRYSPKNKQTNKQIKQVRLQNFKISHSMSTSSAGNGLEGQPLFRCGHSLEAVITNFPRTSARYLADLLRGQELHRKWNLEYSK